MLFKHAYASQFGKFLVFDVSGLNLCWKSFLTMLWQKLSIILWSH